MFKLNKMLKKLLILPSVILFASPVFAQNWANIGTVGTLNNNELCYTDGTDIICDAGLFVNGTAALEVSGTVSATAFVGDGSQLTGVTASSVTLALGDLTDAADDGSSIFIGSGAGAADDGTSNANLAIGRNAMGNSVTRNSSVAIGHDALLNGTDRSVAIGGGAGTSLGFDSVAIGHYAGQSASTHVVAIGRNSGTNAGGGSVVIGEGAGSSVGSGAVAIGRNAGDNIGNYSIAIGENAASAQTAGEYNIVIGRDAQLVDLAGSNQLNIGDAIYGSNLYTTGQSIIGINTTSATESLEVSGTVSATAFVGDGSGLTGLAASLAELTDVSSSMAPSANQLLGYNGSTSEWEPVDPSAAGLWTDAGDYIMRGSARFYDDTTATIDFPNSTRGFFFHEGRGALRAGQSYFAEWDDADVGSLSVGFGNVGRLSGSESFGVGDGVRVTANDGIAMGYRASVTGNQGVAIGSNSTAATLAYAIGNSNSAAGYDYLIGGSNTSTGSGTKAAFGTGNTLLSHRSYAYGANNNVEGYTSGTPTADTQGYNYAFGTNNQVTALNHAIAIGTGMTIAGNNSMGIGVGYSASGSVVADDNTLAIMGASGGVGIGTVSPNAELEVSGTVSATAFVGDGSQLTGLADASSIILNDTSISIIDDNSNTAILAFDVDGARVMEYNVDQVPGFKFKENASRGIFVDNEANDLLLGSLLSASGYKAGVVRVGGDGDNSQVYADANNLRLGTERSNNNFAENIYFETIVRDWSRVNMMIDGGSGRIGMGTETPSTKLEVSGTITANAFVGDGSGLTGVGGLWTDAGDYITRDGFRVYDPSATIDLSTSEGNMAFYHKGKAAFRVGKPYTDLSWDDASIGGGSVAFGTAIASGSGSFAWGVATVNGPTTASGGGDLALGNGAQTTGTNLWKMAIGVNAEASGSPGNTAIGPQSRATGTGEYYGSFALGSYARAVGGNQNMAVGHYAKANTGSNNIAVGNNVQVQGTKSMALGYGILVTGDNSVGIGMGEAASGTDVSDSDTFAIMGASGGVGIGTVSPSAELEVSGTVKATGFVASSDRSLKENIKPLESALENVLNLKGVSYNFKPETGLTQAPQIGLVAQEVKEVYPQVVNGEEGHMSVNYSALVSPLIEAVKELNAKVDQQQSIIEKQQQLIDALMEKK